MKRSLSFISILLVTSCPSVVLGEVAHKPRGRLMTAGANQPGVFFRLVINVDIRGGRRDDA